MSVRLNKETLEEKLSHTLGSGFDVFSELDSTNSYLRRTAHSGLPDGYVVCALSQTAGRGRHGKSFISPRGGVYLSVLLRPQVSAEQCALLTAWAAVAVCDAIEKVCSISPQIKWVNDIVLFGKKICGILSEMVFDETGRAEYVIIGIGVNANTPQDYFSGELSEIASSISALSGKTVDEAALAAEIVRGLRELVTGFPDNRPTIFEDYRRRCATLGKTVSVLTESGPISAFAESLDGDFRLVVRYEDGSSGALLGGDVSVRGLCGYT